MKYKLILCDPPWSYQDKCNSGLRGASHKYKCMSLDEICALQVSELADDDCLLAMWWVGPMPLEAFKVAEAWGFKVRTMKGFTWHKLTKHGKDHIGMGNYTRANSEDCLFAVKGRPKRVDAGVRQFVEAKKGRHSEKPDEVRQRLVRLMGDVPRLEMFGRGEAAEGWDIWGDQAVGSIQLRLKL